MLSTSHSDEHALIVTFVTVELPELYVRTPENPLPLLFCHHVKSILRMSSCNISYMEYVY